MNSLRIYLLISLCLLSSVCEACWFPPRTPRDNMVYRLVEDVSPYYSYCSEDMYYRYETIPVGDERKENLQLWRKQTGCRLSESELETVVYRWSIDKLKQEQKFIVKELGKDGYELLLVAKLCESVRDYLNDPWYYPSKNDPEVMAMNEHLEGASSYRGKLLNRYALQVIRMLMATNRSNDAIEYWEKVKPLLGNDVVTGMAERRVAAAYLKEGKVETAKRIYAKYGDLSSLRFCDIEEKEVWEMIYKECPDSPFFIRELQSILVHYDNRLYQHVMQGSEGGFYSNSWDVSDNDEKEEVTRIMSLARRVIKEKRAKNLDIWYYTLAALLDAECRYNEALNVISEGQRYCKKGSFLANSMRVLRICVEAASSKYDDAYKAHLLSDLKWLDENGRKNMPKKVREMLVPQGHYENYDGRREFVVDENCSYIFDNAYYWSDVISRLCSDILASRLKDEGYVADALMFANMGESWLWMRGHGGFVNSPTYDYYTTMAQMADTCAARDVEKAYLRLVSPQGALDTFLSSLAYKEKGFWSDLIGTYYIKEHKYADAVKWLSRCDRKSQMRMSASEYFDRDPFSPLFGLEKNKKYVLKSKYDYKLNYARNMQKYEYDMHHAKDADVRGEAMVKYGIGLRNQEDWAWALTRYKDSWYMHFEEHDYDYKPIRYKESEKLIDKGLATILNKELKAQYLHAFVRNKEVMDLCSDTKMASYLRSHCDLWRNYRKKS